METVTGYILVGGKSRRMGSDKWRLTLDGRRFVERIADEIETVASSVSLVGDNVGKNATAVELSQPIVPDIYPEWGALGGVHSALSACPTEWALVVACDFPLVSGALFSRLAGFREGFEAVVPIQKDQIPPPLCALYRTVPCLERAGEMINSGERKPIALLQSVRTRWVSFSETADLDRSDHFFDNINTPEDYARITQDQS